MVGIARRGEVAVGRWELSDWFRHNRQKRTVNGISGSANGPIVMVGIQHMPKFITAVRHRH